jgi:hypothetical protein
VDDSQAHGIEERFDLECNWECFSAFASSARKALVRASAAAAYFNDLADDVDDACFVVLMFPRRVAEGRATAGDLDRRGALNTASISFPGNICH